MAGASDRRMHLARLGVPKPLLRKRPADGRLWAWRATPTRSQPTACSKQEPGFWKALVGGAPLN